MDSVARFSTKNFLLTPSWSFAIIMTEKAKEKYILGEINSKEKSGDR
jgi:hypothetical protein